MRFVELHMLLIYYYRLAPATLVIYYGRPENANHVSVIILHPTWVHGADSLSECSTGARMARRLPWRSTGSLP